MAGDGSQHFSMVANYTGCIIPNCAHCYVHLPHDATPEIVERRCFEITGAMRVQMQTAAMTYAHQINSLRQNHVNLEASFETARGAVSWPLV